MVTSDRRLDLAKGEVDVALRAGMPPSEAQLVGRRIAKDTWSFYCSRTYAKRHGTPASLGELSDHQVLGPDPQAFASPLVDWLQRSIPRRWCCVLHPTSMPNPRFGAAHERLRNDPHVRAVLDFLGHHLRSERRQFASERQGRAASAPRRQRK